MMGASKMEAVAFAHSLRIASHATSMNITTCQVTLQHHLLKKNSTHQCTSHRIQETDPKRQSRPSDVVATNSCAFWRNSGPKSARFEITQSTVQSFLPTLQDV